MNCKIEPMNENRRKNVDTLPPRGRVNEVRKEWLVHEDGALAYRLQDEEIKQHLVGNRSRNCQIREDFPCAKHEQVKELEEAAKLHQQLVLKQEEQDAVVAARLADQMQEEDQARKQLLEEEDKELARLLQDKEQQRIERRERDKWSLEQHTPKKERPLHSKHMSRRPAYDNATGNEASGGPASSTSPLYSDDLCGANDVGLPIHDLVQPLRRCNLNESPSPPLMSEEEARRLQEEKDAELARYLQEKEDLENNETTNRDRLLAIETQDKELARLLQERERARARRAKERARQKAALRREAESEVIKVAETVAIPSHHSQQRSLPDDLTYRTYSPVPRPSDTVRNAVVKSKPRYPDPEEIVELPTTDPLSNIAVAIDPTYPRRRGSSPLEPTMLGRPHSSQSSQEMVTDLDEPENQLVDSIPNPAPPYMPIQGHRRLPEKKLKAKEGCKQQ